MDVCTVLHPSTSRVPDFTRTSWLALSALDSFIRRNKSRTIFWSSCVPRLFNNKYLDLNYPHLQCDFPVVIDIKNPKYLLQILLWSPIGHDVENYHKLTKVNVSILKIRCLVINCLMTLFWYHLIEPHNRILKQSLIYILSLQDTKKETWESCCEA